MVRRQGKKTFGAVFFLRCRPRCAFALPGLFVVSGLTIIEAMGLPALATCLGDTGEIIQNSGHRFHIVPNGCNAGPEHIAEFFERAATPPGYRLEISQAALTRAEARYTWKQYAERMMILSRI